MESDLQTKNPKCAPSKIALPTKCSFDPKL
jgi:hypothetical protein